MKAVAIVWIALALVACASPPAPVVRDCPALPVLPASPTAAQRGQHTEALVALYLRCAGVTP
ncbi:hypothetical protein [Variovorax sp. V116]|uniref:hypothetical protein n=1 Tax=Variovorax sp. V116 TaxID=3065953 RepID=UPI0034E8BD22